MGFNGNKYRSCLYNVSKELIFFVAGYNVVCTKFINELDSSMNLAAISHLTKLAISEQLAIVRLSYFLLKAKRED